MVFYNMIMACDLEEIVGILEFIDKIRGSTEKIIINSNIYSHDDNNGDESHHPKNKKYDIYILDGTKKPITFKSILRTFQKMQKQFKNTYGGRSYAFEGIGYNKREGYYELYWAS